MNDTKKVLIEKYLFGEVSPKEKQDFHDLLAEDKDFKSLFIYYLFDAYSNGELPEKHLGTFEKLRANDKAFAGAFENYNNISQRIKNLQSKKTSFSPWRWLSILLGLGFLFTGIYFLFSKNKPQTIQQTSNQNETKKDLDSIDRSDSVNIDTIIHNNSLPKENNPPVNPIKSLLPKKDSIPSSPKDKVQDSCFVKNLELADKWIRQIEGEWLSASQNVMGVNPQLKDSSELVLKIKEALQKSKEGKQKLAIEILSELEEKTILPSDIRIYQALLYLYFDDAQICKQRLLQFLKEDKGIFNGIVRRRILPALCL